MAGESKSTKYALAITLSPENSALPRPATSGASAMLTVLKGSGPNSVENTRSEFAATFNARFPTRSCSAR